MYFFNSYQWSLCLFSLESDRYPTIGSDRTVHFLALAILSQKCCDEISLGNLSTKRANVLVVGKARPLAMGVTSFPVFRKDAAMVVLPRPRELLYLEHQIRHERRAKGTSYYRVRREVNIYIYMRLTRISFRKRRISRSIYMSQRFRDKNKTVWT